MKSAFVRTLVYFVLAACSPDSDKTPAVESGGRASGESHFNKLAMGPHAACAINDLKVVDCWPANADPQTEFSLGSAPFVAGLDFVDAIDLGLQSCALIDSRLRCGGDSNAEPERAPNVPISEFSLGELHGCALDFDGGVHCWGRDAESPLGRFVRVATGGDNSCGISANTNEIRCWMGAELASTVPAGRFARLTVGVGIACGVKANGIATCWTAREQRTLEGTFIDVDAGYGVACLVGSDGRIKCVGTSDLPEAGAFELVAVGRGRACGITGDGGVQCWDMRPNSGLSECIASSPSDGCDGVDNDCDGRLDEDFLPTECGVGRCTSSSRCQDGRLIPCEEEEQQDEGGTCNFVDDDCDGNIDEELDCSCPDGTGLYCGGAIGRDPQTLFFCDRGLFELRRRCLGPCEVGPGATDRCPEQVCEFGDGFYCGDNFGESPNELYLCVDGSLEFTVLCSECLHQPAGVNDGCSLGMNCPNGPGRYCGNELGLNDAYLFTCWAGGYAPLELCQNGCVVEDEGEARCE